MVIMPSAANLKIDKPLPAENSVNVNDTNPNVVTPLRQAITTVEHKIRNLEKRKVTCNIIHIKIKRKPFFHM